MFHGMCSQLLRHPVSFGDPCFPTVLPKACGHLNGPTWPERSLKWEV